MGALILVEAGAGAVGVVVVGFLCGVSRLWMDAQGGNSLASFWKDDLGHQRVAG